ncbi:hypothetical protein RFI_05199 [Reticulomyxa filosa]|uniref:Uncharacterized protein n=1 Tax=Reticulomyxa filosa TaxID=46433 RepID=X6P1C3_RETFI|nr:hypothetical protein RFI_05199 [Reticulomyxa filosa]|eukprot:ETO31918.1 hypothetical protein RFI_05199 [Reticulomyxa filosa]
MMTKNRVTSKKLTSPPGSTPTQEGFQWTNAACYLTGSQTQLTTSTEIENDIDLDHFHTLNKRNSNDKGKENEKEKDKKLKQDCKTEEMKQAQDATSASPQFVSHNFSKSPQHKLESELRHGNIRHEFTNSTWSASLPELPLDDKIIADNLTEQGQEEQQPGNGS